MHTLNRFLVLTLLLVVLVPLGASALILPETRERTREELLRSVDQAKDGYRESALWNASGEANERIAAAAKKRLKELTRKKYDTRLELAALLQEFSQKEKGSQRLVFAEERAGRLFDREHRRVGEFVRAAYGRTVLWDNERVNVGRLLLTRVLVTSLGDRVEQGMRDRAMQTIREDLLIRLLAAQSTARLSRENLHASAGELGDRIVALRKERDTILKEYRDTDRTVERSERAVSLSESQLEEVQRTTKEVQAEILRMQSELARIDTRLRAKAERELVQKGLRDARAGRYAPKASKGGDGFKWPVIGPVSAGFHNAAYVKIFGVPHEGIDIVVPQETSVAAASDGIVFTARDGGTKGYSYVLIGHQGGYATLYGHLSQIDVTPGQLVYQGDRIGLSGGQPGTHGAGPMTTGSHLHFEVLKDGEHVDPRGVLP